MKKFEFKNALVSILFAEFVGLLSSLLAGNIPSAYSQLTLPPLSPPGWVFAVVWPILYFMMGLAVYQVSVYEKDPKKRSQALSLYGFQLFLNFLWSILFFRFQLYWLAFAIILLLDVCVYLMYLLFKESYPKAGKLILPYLLWLLFATYLCGFIAYLN